VGGFAERLRVRRARLRKCIGCGIEFPKPSLLRIVRLTTGEVTVDMSGRMLGRGAYLCANAECVNKARKKNALPRVLKCPVDREIYSHITDLLPNGRDDGIA
jgi:predicted RNA-binding protein YlxR (DUF448 family)